MPSPYPKKFNENLKLPWRCKDSNCIADRDDHGPYCMVGSPGVTETVIPEAPEGVGAAVISSGTLDTPETLEEPVKPSIKILPPPPKMQMTLSNSWHGWQVGDLIELTDSTGLHVVTITEVEGTVLTYEYMTPERYWKRWMDSWLEGIDYKTEIKPRTGRRLYRRILQGDEKRRLVPRVRGCGHKLDLKRQPRHRNCKPCWTAFFRNQDEMAQNIAKIIVEQGQYRIVETFGRKFLKRFHEYCILVERMEALRQAAEQEQIDVILPIDPDGDYPENSLDVG